MDDWVESMGENDQQGMADAQARLEAGSGTLHQHAVPDYGNGYNVPGGFDIERLKGAACSPVAAFGPRHAFHQIQGLEGLHLVSYGTWIAIYQLGNLLALYCSSFDAMNVDQCG